MKELYKQILSDRETTSFRVEAIKNDSQLCEELKTFTVDNGDMFYCGEKKKKINLTENLKNKEEEKNLFKILEDKADLSKVYIKNDRAITDISQSIFGQYQLIKNALEYYFENEKLKKDKKGKDVKFNKTEAEKENKKDYFSFAEIDNALKFYFLQEEFKDKKLEQTNSEENNNENLTEGITKEIKAKALNKPLINYFQNLKWTDKKTNQKFNILKRIKETFESKTYQEKQGDKEIEKNKKNILEIIEKFENIEKEKLKNEKREVLTIKEYLDSIKKLQFFLKPLYVKIKKKDDKKEQNIFDKDNAFYSEFDSLYENLININQLYDRARNYLTKKPFSVEKYKLNFEKSTLLEGWDKNKEENKNNAVIFREDKKYYLGIINAENKNKIFSKENICIWNNDSSFKKMYYKSLGDIKKQLPRIGFADKAKDIKDKENNSILNDEIKNIKDEFDNFQKEKKDDKDKWKNKFDRDKLNKLINYYKSVLESHSEEYVKKYEIEFEETEKYKNLGDFFDDVKNKTYKINFNQGINKEEVLNFVKKGKFYLFEIYSKDFSEKSRGKPNLQTLYWKELFSEENLKDIIYKLEGKAELFYRKASLKYDENIWKNGHHVNDPKKKQKYPIIKDRRYAVNTYLFHVPITCNFKAEGISKFNNKVLNVLKNNKKINIIGIDRGERHLAYYSVINQQGEILEQESFNNPLGKKDYHDLLDKREKEREKAREDWGTIEKIKDLKSGYLSQVVHKICQLMIEHNAIVVFEDLNSGFKKGRFKVEKQIYQKLEKALIDKLNFLVLKEKKNGEPAGINKALQLTAPFESFQKMRKQTGFIFYVPAYHTSKICPKTGFVNLLDPNYETIEKAKDFFSRFDKICFNDENFEFKFNYDKIYKDKKSKKGKDNKDKKKSNWFNKKPKGLEGCKKEWVVYSIGKRLENFRNPENNNQWESREINITKELKELFNNDNIYYENKNCIKNEIVKKTESKFFKQLITLLRLTLQMRNSKIGSDEDYLISPVKNKESKFFDSRDAGENEPKDADANGAYHIGMKGIQLLQKLNNTEEISKFEIDRDNKSWYEFIQNKKMNKNCKK